MAKDTVVLSPEYVGCGKREATATEAILVGQFVQYVVGQVGPATAAVALTPKMVAVENVSNASGIDYTYSTDENVHFRSLPGGVLLNVKADAATYAQGDALEVGVSGLLAAQSAGVTVAVVPAGGGEVVGVGGSLMVELV